MGTRILVIIRLYDTKEAEEQALLYAQKTSRELTAALILDSELYHYGHNDIIVSGRTKDQFLLYIRDQVAQQGRIRAEDLKKRAKELGVCLRIKMIHSEDPIRSVLTEAKKGYDVIFLPRERHFLLPIFKRSLTKELRRNTTARLMPC